MHGATGVAVFSGMIGMTAFGRFPTPVSYVLLRRLSGNRPLKQHGAGAPVPARDPIEQAAQGLVPDRVISTPDAASPCTPICHARRCR